MMPANGPRKSIYLQDHEIEKIIQGLFRLFVVFDGVEGEPRLSTMGLLMKRSFYLY